MNNYQIFKLSKPISVGLIIIGLFFSKVASAEIYELPKGNNDIVGKIQTAIVQPGEDFPSIAEKYDVTYTGLVEANPSVNPKAPKPGTVLIIPSAYVLPDAPRKGIVINLAELRLYYYPPHENVVITYPVGIGVIDWTLPLGEMKIIEKKKNPTWHVPPSVHEELKKKGFNLPFVIPPGPDNPLGDYMMRLSERTYLIHSVQDPTTVGRRSSSGCIRMYPENIEQLFSLVKVGTPVRVINEPYKVGFENQKLYLEAHLPLQEQQLEKGNDLSAMINNVNVLAKKQLINSINWDKAFTLAKQPMGLPEAIGGLG